MINKLIISVIALHISSLTPALSQTGPKEQWIHGTAHVLDGDSIEVDGREIRLFAIDAPELQQTCQSGSRSIPCGVEATDFLADMIEGQTVRCRIDQIDHYERILGSCIWNARNINEIIVLTGNAIAWTHHSQIYNDVQKQAIDKNVGIWKTKFQPPEEWRKDQDIKARQFERQQNAQPNYGTKRGTPVIEIR